MEGQCLGVELASRRLHPTAIAPVGAARGVDDAHQGGHRGDVLDVTPQHHLAAVTVVGGASVDEAVGAHTDACSLAQCAATLRITADQHHPTCSGSCGVHARRALDADFVALHLNTSGKGALAIDAQLGVAA